MSDPMLTARLVGFGTLEDRVGVVFEMLAAQYYIVPQQPDFAGMVMRLAEAWQHKQAIQFTFVGNQILTINIVDVP